MMQRFEGIAQFLDPNEVSRGVEALAAVGCKFVRDASMVDACGPTVFGTISGESELLDENALWNRLQNILEPFDAEVCELGFDDEGEKTGAPATL